MYIYVLRFYSFLRLCSQTIGGKDLFESFCLPWFRHGDQSLSWRRPGIVLCRRRLVRYLKVQYRLVRWPSGYGASFRLTWNEFTSEKSRGFESHSDQYSFCQLLDQYPLVCKCQISLLKSDFCFGVRVGNLWGGVGESLAKICSRQIIDGMSSGKQ